MQHPYDQIEELALGDLEPDVQRSVLEHADACPTCAVLVANTMAGMSALAELETPQAVKRSAPLRALPRRVAPSVWLASAAAAAALALLWWNVELRGGAPVVPIAALVHSHFIHHALHGAGGSAKMIQAADGSWLYVVGDGLTPRGRYELWERRNAALHDVGAFSADGSGRTSAFWQQDPGSVDGIVVAPAGVDPHDSEHSLHWP